MSSTEHSKIKSWNWDTTYKSVNEQLFRKMLPTKVDAPTLLVYNYELAAEMDLQDYSIDEAILRKPKGHDFVIDRRHNRPAVSRHMSVTGG